MTPSQEARVRRLEALAGDPFFDYQYECFDYALGLVDTQKQRLCLYYRTGAGKTLTALVTMNLWGQNNVLVVTPPSAQDIWRETAGKLGMGVDVMSHAKFRMSSTKLERGQAIIADEMHLFGGHDGKGWKKLDTAARGLQAPIILASATPNYNDADRVYCIQHVLDPHGTKGGFLEFLYKNCITEQNHFSMMPDVVGFQRFQNAEEYLAALPYVRYVPDTVTYKIKDHPIAEKIPPAMAEFGLDERRKRIIASIIEGKHARVFHSLINDDGMAQDDVRDLLIDWIDDAMPGSVLIYCNHSTVADAIHLTLWSVEIEHEVVTGKTSLQEKQKILDRFRDGYTKVLVGTASLATGTDGLDKVCDELIIVDDTDDDALRRQLIGRIMPRGSASSSARKRVHRLVLQ